VGSTMDTKVFEDPKTQAELERRLDLLMDPDYKDDPARQDYTAADFLAIAAFVVILSLAFFIWGYLA